MPMKFHVSPPGVSGGGAEDGPRVPMMNQKQFIYMWRTLYDMFSEEQAQPEIFHSIAHVGEYFSTQGDLTRNTRRFYSQHKAIGGYPRGDRRGVLYAGVIAAVSSVLLPHSGAGDNARGYEVRWSIRRSLVVWPVSGGPPRWIEFGSPPATDVPSHWFGPPAPVIASGGGGGGKLRLQW